MYTPHHFPYLPVISQDYKKQGQIILQKREAKLKPFNLKGGKKHKIKSLQATEHLPLYRRSEAADQKLGNQS